jgi:hypothetical protein
MNTLILAAGLMLVGPAGAGQHPQDGRLYRVDVKCYRQSDSGPQLWAQFSLSCRPGLPQFHQLQTARPAHALTSSEYREHLLGRPSQDFGMLLLTLENVNPSNQTEGQSQRSRLPAEKIRVVASILDVAWGDAHSPMPRVCKPARLTEWSDEVALHNPLKVVLARNAEGDTVRWAELTVSEPSEDVVKPGLWLGSSR